MTTIVLRPYNSSTTISVPEDTIKNLQMIWEMIQTLGNIDEEVELLDSNCTEANVREIITQISYPKHSHNDFARYEVPQLVSLINAFNYLDCPQLLNLGCKNLATRIRTCSSHEEVEQLFHGCATI